MTDHQNIVFELSYAELLFVRAAIERDRELTRRDIDRGKATADDLQIIDGLAGRLGSMFFRYAPRTADLLFVRAVPPSGTGDTATSGRAVAHPVPCLDSQKGGAL